MSIYTDLNFLIRKHPFTNDLLNKTDVSAVKQALLNLLLTAPREKLFSPDFGVNLRGLLFENYSPLVKITLKKVIENQINHFEPRVELKDVVIKESPDYNAIEITLFFFVKGVKDIQSLTHTVERIR